MSNLTFDVGKNPTTINFILFIFMFTAKICLIIVLLFIYGKRNKYADFHIFGYWLLFWVSILKCISYTFYILIKDNSISFFNYLDQNDSLLKLKISFISILCFYLIYSFHLIYKINLHKILYRPRKVFISPQST